jgi:hypothetical protein
MPPWLTAVHAPELSPYTGAEVVPQSCTPRAGCGSPAGGRSRASPAMQRLVRWFVQVATNHFHQICLSAFSAQSLASRAIAAPEYLTTKAPISAAARSLSLSFVRCSMLE